MLRQSTCATNPCVPHTPRSWVCPKACLPPAPLGSSLPNSWMRFQHTHSNQAPFSSLDCVFSQRQHLGARTSRRRLPAPTAFAASTQLASAAGPDPWYTLAVLSTCAAVSQLLENHTAWGAIFTAPLLALVAALACTMCGLLPVISPVYDAVWQYLMPLSVALYLLDHDITSLAYSGGKVLVSFLLGACTMFVGAWAAWNLLGASFLGPNGAQLVCCLLASYIGGSVNFAAVAAATALPTALIPPAVAADNLAMLVLLAALIPVPAHILTALNTASRAPQAAAAGNGKAAAVQHSLPSRNSSVVPRRSTLSHVRGLDGSSLLTDPPSPAAVAACSNASSAGRTAIGNSSSSSGYRSSGSYKQHALSHRAVVHTGLDGSPLLTPDPVPSSAAGFGSSSNGKGGSRSSSSRSRSSSSSSSRNCGGCRGSNVTALDDNPLLTKAPAMSDAISTINAAREGKQQLRTAPRPSSGSGSISDHDGVLVPGSDVDDGVVGCGGCEEAWNAMEATSSSRSPFSSSSSTTKPSGALALDGGLLFTEDPGEDRVAVAVAAAKAGSSAKSANVSVSDSALSSLADSDTEDLELVVRFSWKEFKDRLKKEQQQQQLLLPADWEKISASSSTDSSSDGEDHGPAAATSRSSTTLTSPASTSKAPATAAEAVTMAGSAVEAAVNSVSAANGGTGSLTASSAAAALAAAAVACATGRALSVWFSAPALQLLLISCCALALSVMGNAAHKAWIKQQQQAGVAVTVAATASGPYAGSSDLGQLLIGIFFATLGASCCCSWSSFTTAAPQVAFITTMVIVHWGLLALLGRVLGPHGLNLCSLSAEVLLVGSAANVGGAATAAAVASARGWQGLVQPALLCGSLGYAVGTAGGMFLARCLGVLPA